MRMQADISNLDHRYTVYNNFHSLCLESLYLHNCLLVGYFVVFAGKENEEEKTTIMRDVTIFSTS